MAQLTQQQYDELVKKGLTPEKIKTIASNRGYDLPSQKKDGVVTGFVKGAVKGLIGDVARPTAQMLQGLGQRGLAALTPSSLEEVQTTTGLASLKDTTPEGQSVVQSLKTQGGAELAGRVAANVASFFIPTSPAIGVTGRVVSGAGKVATRGAIGLTAKEAPLVQAYRAGNSVPQRILSALSGKNLSNKPITNADTLLRQNLFGTKSMIGVKATRASKNLWNNVVNPVLEKTTEKVNMPSFIKEIQMNIDSIPELTRRKELQTALNAFKQDYGKVKNITYPQLQKFKEGWATFVPDKAYKGKPIAQSFREVQNMAASLARNKIYKLFPDDTGKVAYLDYGNLLGLKKMGQDAMTGSRLKGGAGSFVSDLYSRAITPIATTGGLGLYKTGEGLQFVGRAGAKILGELFK